jgi:serine/threonine protein kinase
MKNLSISENLQIKDRAIVIREGASEWRLNVYRIEKELGRGANGVAFLVTHDLFERTEVLKVWVKLRPNDLRDKVRQGIAEAKKAHQAAGDFVPRMFHAEIVGPVFFATMEFIPGETLKTRLRSNLGLGKRWWLARLFMNGIRKTMEAGAIHGDAHPGNIIVTPHPTETGIEGVRLLDFGTSLFVRPNAVQQRHWSVIDKTMKKLLSTFENYTPAARQHIRPFDPTTPDIIRLAYYDDLLDSLRLEAHADTPSVPRY